MLRYCDLRVAAMDAWGHLVENIHTQWHGRWYESLRLLRAHFPPQCLAELPPWFMPAGGYLVCVGAYLYNRGGCTCTSDSKPASPDPRPQSSPDPLLLDSSGSSVIPSTITAGSPRLGKYVVTRALPNIGSRVHKFWALGYDTERPENKLLFVMIQVSKRCTLKFPECLPDLNAALTHIRENVACIHPVVEVLYSKAYNRVVIVEPFVKNGSLKDMIYGTEPETEWANKYTEKHPGLPVGKVSQYCCHSLEATLCLYGLGFPPLGHVQSGNVFVHTDGDGNEVCKLGGYENTLLGYNTRLYKLYRDRLQHIDVQMSGHLLFENACAYELTTPNPTREDFEVAEERGSEIINELQFIFEAQHSGDYAQVLKQIHDRSFFARNDTLESSLNSVTSVRCQPLQRILACVRSGVPADNTADPVLLPDLAQCSSPTEVKLAELKFILAKSDTILSPLQAAPRFVTSQEDVKSEEEEVEVVVEASVRPSNKPSGWGVKFVAGVTMAGKSLAKGGKHLILKLRRQRTAASSWRGRKTSGSTI